MLDCCCCSSTASCASTTSCVGVITKRGPRCSLTHLAFVGVMSGKHPVVLRGGYPSTSEEQTENVHGVSLAGQNTNIIEATFFSTVEARWTTCQTPAGRSQRLQGLGGEISGFLFEQIINLAYKCNQESLQTQTDALMTDDLVIFIRSTHIIISLETDLCFNRCWQNGSQANR